MKKTHDEKLKLLFEVLLHIVAWLMIFFFPQMMFMREDGFSVSLHRMIPMMIGPITLAIIFYSNYLWLVPRYMMKLRWRSFAIINIFLIIGVVCLNTLWHHNKDKFLNPEWNQIDKKTEMRTGDHGNGGPGKDMMHIQLGHGRPIAPDHHPDGDLKPSHDKKFRGPKPFEGRRLGRGNNLLNEVAFGIRDAILYVLTIALACILHMGFRFRKAELARKQAELKHTETELQSLKNQVSPHFLLNTLNNIYALVQIDQTKAQESIISLSRMLSHMLYQNKETYTTLEREVEFLKSYVDLMELRVSDNVKVELVADLKEGGQMQIAPLLYISLVENAFKHGIGCEGGHISIRIEANPSDGTISAFIRNSNHPKTAQDKSGHGVGLMLVQRRLELLYPDRYTWEKGVNEETNEYYSNLIILTT